MLEHYKIIDLPKVAKVISLGELSKLPSDTLFVVEVDSDNPDELNDMVDLFGSATMGDKLFIVVSKGVDIKAVVNESIKSMNEYPMEETPVDGGINVFITPPSIDSIPEADLPQYGERKTEVWEDEYRAFNNRPQ